MSIPQFLDRCNRAARSLISPGRPSFLIIGAQKAGTTALHDILRQHSKIDPARHKEIHFFDNAHWYARRYRSPYFKVFPHRNHSNRDHLFFEATPDYLYHPEAPPRIRAYNPNMKLIVLLREPASRTRSAWIMFHHSFGPAKNAKYYDPCSFSQRINEGLAQGAHASFYNNHNGYIARGLYAQQLKRMFKFFDQEQVLILENRQLLDDYSQTTDQILEFLELPREELPFLKSFPSSIDSQNLYPDEMLALRKFFKPHNEELFELLGRDYGWNEGIS